MEDLKFNYMLLDRCKQDCKYYLGYGNRNAKNLWGGNEKEHIEKMLELFDGFLPSQKPEWISRKDILDFAKQMGVKVPKMTPTVLKKLYKQNNPEGHFFDRDTMRCFGQKMSGMEVLKDTKLVNTGNSTHECYVLMAKGLDAFDFPVVREYCFDTETFEYIVW